MTGIETRACPCAAAVVAGVFAILAYADGARAAIFEITSGFSGQFALYGSGEPATTDSGPFSFGGALCPAPGGPNFFCGRVRGFSGFSGNRVTLRAEARLRRTAASASVPNVAAYSDVRAYSGPISGYTATAPGAYFVFGLGGTLVNTTTDPDVTTMAFAVASVAGSGPYEGIQCFGTTCQPHETVQVKVQDWNVSGGFYLRLRSDVVIANPQGKAGWDAEVVADFNDTLELLAIQLLDENDQPIPNVHLSLTDANGQAIPIPDTPPTSSALPTPTPTPALPMPTATACASFCEDCTNCIDDDGDTLVDRTDPDCAPPANGGGGGLADDAAAKRLDRCAKTLVAGGRKLAAARLDRLGSCLSLGADCLRTKGGSAACVAKAHTGCTKARAALAASALAVQRAIEKACAEPTVATSDLFAQTGLGFDGERAGCAAIGIAPLQSLADVVACMQRRQACAVDRLLGAAVPRAAELLALGNVDVAAELPCLPLTGGGGGGGAAETAKALRRCETTLQKATAKLLAARSVAVSSCGAGVFRCLQTKRGDSMCLTKASAHCTKAIAALPKLDAAFADRIAKQCGAPPLGIETLRAPEGLGFAMRDDACAALGAGATGSIGDLTDCLGRTLTCRVGQLLEHATPRLVELLGIAGTPLP